MHTTLKKKLLKKSGIYLVTDGVSCCLSHQPKDLLAVISSAVKAGVDIVQFRDKAATDKEFLAMGYKIKKFLKRKNVLFIVDDRVDLAYFLDADGVHLGQDDIGVDQARKILGRNKIIGFSTHSMAQLRLAVKKDVDYISIGPVFATPTKPDYKAVGLDLIKSAARLTKVPLVAIGGINERNIKEVVKAGAQRVAVVRAILSKNDPFMAAKDLIKRIRSI